MFSVYTRYHCLLYVISVSFRCCSFPRRSLQSTKLMSSCSWYQFRNRSFVFSVHDGREIIVPLHLLPPPSLTAPIVWSVCAHRVLKLEGDVWQRVVSICARAVPWGFVSGTGRLCADWCICEVSEGYGDFAALFCLSLVIPMWFHGPFCLSLVIPMWFHGPFLFIPCNSYVIFRPFFVYPL